MSQLELQDKLSYQVALDHFGESLPNERSRPRIVKSKEYFRKRKLDEKALKWLLLHDESNWKEISLKQEYENKNGLFDVKWMLPGTLEKKEDCGKWMTRGCFNYKIHPGKMDFVVHNWKSCFRSGCEKCWLEKWLAREASRATSRIDNYSVFWKKFIGPVKNRLHVKPIHIIVSPPWRDKFMRFDLLKKKCRILLKKAGVEGGLMIYHPFAFDKENQIWVVRPHFHIIGFGWVVDTSKISDEEGWVIKNKGLRKSLHSTIYYQLSHAGVNESGLHSITWFGSISYRAKYSQFFKPEEEEPLDFCPNCGMILVNCSLSQLDRPPTDYEFEGYVRHGVYKADESINDSVNRYNSIRGKKLRSNRKDFEKNGQGIGTDYSKWIENKTSFSNTTKTDPDNRKAIPFQSLEANGQASLGLSEDNGRCN